MKGSTPKSCSDCRGNLRAQPLISRFAAVDYGHSICPRCGITFDSNINEMLEVQLSAEDIDAIEDERRFRELFVETSRISSESGEIYGRFKWEDNRALREGVASHVVQAIERHQGTPASIVDVGCGDGFTSMIVAKRFPACAITAIDPSPLIMRLQGHPQITPIRGTLQSASLQEGAFDAVFIIGNWMLHFDPFATAKEAHRIMKDDGILVIDFKNIRSMSRRLARFALRVGVDRLGGRWYLQRNFVNMRYGMHKDFVRAQMHPLGFEILEMQSKPPRLLEFKNKSSYQAGVMGLLWRFLDTLDKLRDERAWVQVVLRKAARGQA